MSGGITAGEVAALVGAASTVYSASQAGKGAPKVQAPVAPAQAAQAPDEVARRKAKNGLTPALAATMLTGASGISSSSLAVGANKLLGQ